MATCPDTWTGPKICPELQTRPKAGDCGPCTVIEALYIASCGKFAIGDRDRRTELIVQMRKRGGSADTGATWLGQMVNAYNHWRTAAEFADLGLRAPHARLMLDCDVDTDLEPELAAGKWAMVSLKYTAIDAFQDGRVSGQPGYTGGHMMVIGQYRIVSGNAWVTMVDPLADGRRADVAKGPQAIRFSAMRTAMDDYTSVGEADAAVFVPVRAINTGPTPATVPNVINTTVASAITAIEAADLQAGDRTDAYHASIVSGRVTATDPVAATSVPSQSFVDYTVSLGPPPVVTIDPHPPRPCEDPSS